MYVKYGEPTPFTVRVVMLAGVLWCAPVAPKYNLGSPSSLLGSFGIFSRMNRGFRVQYSSALGPYEGGLHFVGGMSSDGCKASFLVGV